MAAAGAPTQKGASRARAPRVNLSDIPEMMPGAQPGANPAQRMDFEQFCRKLHDDEVVEKREAAAVMREVALAEASSVSSSLEAMFPLLDAALVRALSAEAPTQQQAIETLLVLSASMSEPGEASTTRATMPPPRLLGVEDRDKFPSLGREPARRCESQDPPGAGGDVAARGEEEKDLGSAWCDRAKAAADMPAPRPTAWASAVAAPRRRKDARSKDDADEPQHVMTDYEFRHRVGQRRARRRLQYGRRGGRGGAAGAQAKRHEAGSGSESEASDEGGEGGDGADLDNLEADEEGSWASRRGPLLRHHPR